MTVAMNIPTIRRYSNARQWLRGLLRSSIHSATGAVLSGGGTNMLEGMGWDGIGLTVTQMGGVFVATLLWSSMQYVHQATAPGQSQPPFTKEQP